MRYNKTFLSKNVSRDDNQSDKRNIFSHITTSDIHDYERKTYFSCDLSEY